MLDVIVVSYPAVALLLLELIDIVTRQGYAEDGDEQTGLCDGSSQPHEDEDEINADDLFTGHIDAADTREKTALCVEPRLERRCAKGQRAQMSRALD